MANIRVTISQTYPRAVSLKQKWYHWYDILWSVNVYDNDSESSSYSRGLCAVAVWFGSFFLSLLPSFSNLYSNLDYIPFSQLILHLQFNTFYFFHKKLIIRWSFLWYKLFFNIIHVQHINCLFNSKYQEHLRIISKYSHALVIITKFIKDSDLRDIKII